ncbi:hypothetical protein GGF50DRAFT_64921 [Schizophyllum commune]
MHHALFVPDIVSLILDCFVWDHALPQGQYGPYDVDRPALAACARTCRAFHTPAVAALWKDCNLDLETVLLHCMPADVWEVARRGNSPRVDYMTLRRPVTHEDINRLLAIAPLINKLIVGGLRSKMLVQGSYSSVSSFLPKGVFSNLRHLEWASGGADLTYLYPLLTSNLAVYSPHISHFDVCLPNEDGNGVAKLDEGEVAHLLRTWNLRHLRAEGLDYGPLADLDRWPSLLSLDLKFRDEGLKSQSIDFHPMSFAALQVLHLYNVDMHVVIALLRNSTFDSLDELCLNPIHTVSRDWPELYRAANSAIVRPELMTTFVIELGEPNTSLKHLHESSAPMTDKDLIPFFQFRNLTTLALRHPGGFDVGSSTIECLAEALPHLTTFALSSMKQPQCQPRAGLHVLESLAMHCPDLRSVRSTLDARGTSFRSPPPTGAGATEIHFDFGRDGHEGEVEEDDESSLDEEDVESSDDESD